MEGIKKGQGSAETALPGRLLPDRAVLEYRVDSLRRVPMLMTGEQVRLNARERKLLRSLTRSSPDHIRTRTQLANFVQVHLVNYPGRTPEERLLRRLLESFLPA